MDYWATLKAPEAAKAPSPFRSPSRSDDGVRRLDLTDAARGRRRLDIDGDGRPMAWIDGDGVALDFTHDDAGNLRRIASGDWFVAIDGSDAGSTFAATDPGGRTEMLLAREGRVRTLKRGGDRVSIEMDALERVCRVRLPGSVNALAYEWDEDGGCVIRAEGCGPLLTLSEAGPARRIALDDVVWWEEDVLPTRVKLRASIGGLVCDTLEIKLSGLAAIVERRWADGSGDRFERDERERLSAWTTFDAEGDRETRRWRYAEDDLAEDSRGVRAIGEGGRVRALGGVGYRYDGAGRRIARTGDAGETRYCYDPLGTLAGVETPDGELTRFETDGLGRRVAARRGAAVRHEHRDEAGRLWAVTDDHGRALHTYIWLGDRIVARVDGALGAPVAEAYLCDPLGTPNGVLVASGEDWRFERVDAPPYGRTDNAARPTLYGHFGDPATGLIHFGARDFDPELGLFLNPDPWHGGEDDPRRWGGATAAELALHAEQPLGGAHDYALCRFDPLGRYDRDGHCSTGEVFLHILRYILMPTWGFPLTAVSVFFFEPFNLYMEIVGLIVWGFKQLCEDKSHPWGNHTIVKSTWLLGSARQATFAFGLNGFLPRVVSGGGPSADRAVTVGNVIWINRIELAFMARAEVVELDDIGGDAAGTKFNDDPGQRSVVALLVTDAEKQNMHVSPWTRGLGNAVAMRAVPTPGGGPGVLVQAFADVPPPGSPAGTPARGTINLRHPAPVDMKFPTKADSKQKLEVTEFRCPMPPAVTATLEAQSEVWFSLKVDKDTGFKPDEWLRISAPKADDPKPDAAFRRIRFVLDAPDHAALVLNDVLPPRFGVPPAPAPKLSSGLMLEIVEAPAAAATSAKWTVTAAATTITRTPAPADADFPPNLSSDSMVQITATNPAGLPPVGGVAISPPENVSFTTIKAMRLTLKLEPDTGGAKIGSILRRCKPEGGGPTSGVVAKKAARDKITFLKPFPDIAKDDLLVVTIGGGPVYVRAKDEPVDGILTLTEALAEALVPADMTAVTVQLFKPDGEENESAKVAKAIPGADIDATVIRGNIFAANNLVQVDVDGVLCLRRIKAVVKMEIDLADAPVGAGDLTLKRAGTVADRVRKKVELAPPGRFLKWTGGTALATFGAWPAKLVSIELAGGDTLRRSENAVHYVRWAARPPGFAEDFHGVWASVTQGADQYVVLESPLPFLTRDKMLLWRSEIDDHGGETDIWALPPPAPVVPGAPPPPPPMLLTMIEYTAGAKRVDAGDRRVLAVEPETLVPEEPTIHDTHRRALIEHEIHHTVQCNFWGPLMTALPLQGLIMSVTDIVAAAGVEIPEWMSEIDRDADGNRPEKADGRIKHNTGLNPFQVFSIGGILQLSWKYAFLAPFHASPKLHDEIIDWDFDTFTKVFNPISRLLIQRLPQVKHDDKPGQRWGEMLLQTIGKALDLRSWTAFLGFVPTLLPDGATSFIEQGASRASGDLYSTILTANDRYNLRTCGRMFGSTTHLDADLHAGIGRPLRMLMYCGYRGNRVLESIASDIPGRSLVFRNGFGRDALFTITLADPLQKGLFQESLYDVKTAGGAAAPTVMIEGPPSARGPVSFAMASHGDIVTPRLRALVPLPPRVNRSLGFYLIAGAAGKLIVKAPHPQAVDAKIKIGGTVGGADSVTLIATSTSLAGSPVSIGPIHAAPADKNADLAQKIAAAITGSAALPDITADVEDNTVRIKKPRGQAAEVVWTVQKTGSVNPSVSFFGQALKDDPRTELVTLTIEEEVKLGGELIPWRLPLAVAAPAAAPLLKRYQTEEGELHIGWPKDFKAGKFVDAGTIGFELEAPGATVSVLPLPGTGWKVIMPAGPAAPAAIPPVRLRLYRIIKKADPAFDLTFKDVPTLAGVHSFLDADTFVVVRDVVIEVERLPKLLTKSGSSDKAVELKLPVRLAGKSEIVIAPVVGVKAPPVSRIGDDGRGEKWNIGPMEEPPPDDVVFKVHVHYGRPGSEFRDEFDLTLKPPIKITAASYEVSPGVPLELNVAGSTEAFSVEFIPKLDGLDATMPGGKIRLLASKKPSGDKKIKVKVTDKAGKVGIREVTVKDKPLPAPPPP